MDTREAIRTTGAVRRFTDEPVDRATVLSILDDARFAPSGGNRQPWRVAIVDDTTIRREIATLIQPVWEEYAEASSAGGATPFNMIDYVKPPSVTTGRPNVLLQQIDTIPAVLAIAADLSLVATMDTGLDRAPITSGASIYPFCWNVMLAARARGLGGVMTTFLSRVEPAAAPPLGLPDDHALASVIFLGVPEFQPTRLRRHPVEAFTTIDRFDGRPPT